MKYCPCCSHRLLQQISNNQVYWFCRTCWQEMPLLKLENSIQEKSESLVSLRKWKTEQPLEAQSMNFFHYYSNHAKPI